MDNEKPEYWWIERYGDISNCEGDYASAFTVAELGEMLPSFIFNGEDRKFLYCYADDLGFWRTSYAKCGKDGIAVDKKKNEADSRALMLILLIEQNIVKP